MSDSIIASQRAVTSMLDTCILCNILEFASCQWLFLLPCPCNLDRNSWLAGTWEKNPSSPSLVIPLHLIIILGMSMWCQPRFLQIKDTWLVNREMSSHGSTGTTLVIGHYVDYFPQKSHDKYHNNSWNLHYSLPTCLCMCLEVPGSFIKSNIYFLVFWM